MPETLTPEEAAALAREINSLGETVVSRTTGVHRQTLNRAVNRRRLYARTREAIRRHLAASAVRR